MIIPVGVTDVVGRILAEGLQARTGQAIIPENVVRAAALQRAQAATARVDHRRATADLHRKPGGVRRCFHCVAARPS